MVAEVAMNWAIPQTLWFLLLLIPLIWWVGHHYKKRKELLKALRYDKTIWRGAELSLLGLVAVSLILALAQPRGGFTTIEVERENREVVIVLDLSRSMWAVDQSPSRIERARRELMDVKQVFKGERVGLVFFAEGAFARMPLTQDYGLLGDLVSDLDPEYVRSQGSDIAAALSLASELFTSDSGGGRSILLISDGEDHGQKMEEVTKELTKKEIPVFVIGVGAEEGGRIPLKRGGFLRDRGGQVVITQRKTEALKKIAELTQGAYVSSIPGTEDLNAIYKQGILKTEQSSQSTDEEGVWEEFFMWPLSFGFALFILSLFPLRVPKLPFLILFLIPLSASAGELSNLQQKWADQPENLELAEELGFKLLEQGKAHDARLLLDHVAREAEGDQKSRALYNAGIAAYQEGLLDHAASYFQQAVQNKGSWEEAQNNHRAVLEEIARRKQQQQQQQQQQQEEGENSEEDQEEGEEQEGEQQEGEQQEGEQQEGEQQEGEQQQGEQQEGEEQEGEEQEGEQQEGEQQQGQEQASEEDFAQQQEEKEVDLDQLDGAEEQDEQKEESAAKVEEMRAEQGEQVTLSEDEQLLEGIEEARPRWVYGEGTGGNKEW